MSHNWFVQHPEVMQHILKHEAASRQEQPQDATPEHLLQLMDDLWWEVNKPIHKGQRQVLQGQVSLLRLRFTRYIREQAERTYISETNTCPTAHE